MAYKLSGTLSSDARIIVINESDWSIESNTEETSGSYEIDPVEAGDKLVVAIKSDGELLAYGDVVPEEYTPAGDRGVFGGGAINDSGSSTTNVMEYITVSTTGNGTDFGDLLHNSYTPAGCSNGNNARGIFAGGGVNGYSTLTNIIQYITITSAGNATDGGDLTRAKRSLCGVSNGTDDRGVFAGSWDGSNRYDEMEYITISTASNGADFGDLTTARSSTTGTSNGTYDRGIIAGGTEAGSTRVNKIEYITITSLGDSTDFGDLLGVRNGGGAVSNGTGQRGVFSTWYDGNNEINVIEYITINSAGNSTDFGDLTQARYSGAGVQNAAGRGVFGGGHIDGGWPQNTMDYITIATTGNATDFGDLISAKSYLGSVSNS